MKLYTNEWRDALGVFALLVFSTAGLITAGFLMKSYTLTALCLSCLYFFLMSQCLIAGTAMSQYYTIKYLTGKEEKK